MKKIFLPLTALAVLAFASCTKVPKDGIHTLTLLTTNDVHGTWFDSTYVGHGTRRSLLAINTIIDSVRAADGKGNVVLVDAGDCLQGDNAPYYYNYVDTLSPHLFPRLMSYMGYDAIAVGNHDIETGHPVYDRIAKELKAKGIPFLAGNAIRTSDGKPYFHVYTMLKKAGLRVAVLGYTNANMKEWLQEEIWSGMTFESLIPLVQNDVDKVRAKEKPDVVIVAVHSGNGNGDGRMLEGEGLDLLNTLHGVDFLVCSHDHRPSLVSRDSILLINSGSHSRNVGFGKIEVTVKGGKVVDRKLSSRLIPVRREFSDSVMRKAFQSDYEAVKAFTLNPVGTLQEDFATREAFRGMCPYINFIHTLCLEASGADISFAAPLSYNKTIKAGTLAFNDLFTLYPFENQLFVLRMNGHEIKGYLEDSYDSWLAAPGGAHALLIQKRDDPRTGQANWSFISRTYNFSSAAGINYTVDITKPRGERITILSMADGSEFGLDREYNVAMTSYRASGGGGMLYRGAGIEDPSERIVRKYPEIRNLIYDYLKKHGTISVESEKPSVLGEWKFIPEDMAAKAIDADMALVFGN